MRLPRRWHLWTALALVAAALAGCASVAADGAARPGAPNLLSVVATVETKPVPHGGDAADDPAIWVNPASPGKSTVIGTDKKGGIAVYDLQGRQLQYLADGDMNNVDLRRGFELGGKKVALVTASERSRDEIAVYRVDPATRKLVDVAARRIEAGISVYGSCMYRSSKTGAFYVFVASKAGEVEQWRLAANSAGRVDAVRVRSFDVGSQSEGCVADDQLGFFYVAEESTGIWKYGAEPGAGTGRTLVDSTRSSGHLTKDVEGLTIAYESSGAGYLIASSQGSDSFAVYRRQGANAFVKAFEIAAGNGIDAVGGTDGIDVTTADLGGAFRGGLFVAQDGRNDTGNQNFKLVPLESILGS